MGSRRSLLLTEWKSLTYGLITVNYQQREEFAGGQLNPTHGFSGCVPRISVLCHTSQGHSAPPQRTNCAEKSQSPGISLGWKPFCRWQHGNCLASQPFGAPWHQSLIYIFSITLGVTQWEVPQLPEMTPETMSGQWRLAENVLPLPGLHHIFESVSLLWQSEANKQSSGEMVGSVQTLCWTLMFSKL